jgi:hypothetical protein
MTASFKEGVLREFEGVDLGDPRRNQRLRVLAERAAQAPATSFPKMMSPAELEGAYRFLNNVKVLPADILRPHVQETLRRVAQEPLILVAHDSSVVSFNSDGESREGLASIGGEKQQFLVHCSLALRADGSRRPLGVLAATDHLPVKTEDGSLQDRWAQHLQVIHGLGVAPSAVIHLMDREADDYEVLDLCERLGTRFVIRVQHNRKVENTSLRETVETAIAIVERDVPLSRRTARGSGSKQKRIHPPRDSRTARLSVAARTVMISRPRNAAAECAKDLTLNVVRVWESEPPADQPPVEWLLYTSEPIATPDDVLRVVDWYRARWTIEEYFKALKTGCALEKRQLEDLAALVNVLALFIPIAWRLLLLKSEARDTPTAPATTILEPEELKVLRIAGRKKLSANPTVEEAMLAIAALGGHLKHNGRPGWQTLAHGYLTLQAMMLGWRLRSDFDQGKFRSDCDE